MFYPFKRAAGKSVRQSRMATRRAAAKALQSLFASVSEPAPPKRAANPAPKPVKPAPKPTTALPKLRGALGETLRRIKAGGMPEAPPHVTLRLGAPRGASFKSRIIAAECGKRSYKLYIPASAASVGPGAKLPLVVMLHGCSQTPDDFARGTRMNALAEEFRILVAYPTQPSGANSNRCWNWYNVADQARGAGEPALIAGIASRIIAEENVDPARVYVAGLSAGGAAAATVAAAYPDIFAAAGVHSGLPVGAAHNAATGFLAMRQGDPGVRPTVPMPTIIFHGDADKVVHPRNGRFIEARSLVNFPGLKATVRTGRTPGGRSFRKTMHRIGAGKPYCEHWVIEGAGHAWSGGHASGSFTDPAGPDASREMLRFFLRHRTTQKQRRASRRTPH
jgi:poly(hydroxyalkanoate) depolymerase family esterase